MSEGEDDDDDLAAAAAAAPVVAPIEADAVETGEEVEVELWVGETKVDVAVW